MTKFFLNITDFREMNLNLMRGESSNHGDIKDLLGCSDADSFATTISHNGIIFSFGKIYDEARNVPSHDNLWKSVLHRPKNFYNDFWGSYFIIFVCRKYGFARIFFDPCGSLPIFVAKSERGMIVGSDVERVIEVAENKFDLNIDALRQYVSAGSVPLGMTGFDGVESLEMGWFYDYHFNDLNLIRRSRWTPTCKNIRDPKRENPHAILSETIKDFFPRDKKILLELSGGLDSTLLASALHKAGNHVKTLAVCYVGTEDSANDEAEIAQQVATQLNISFVRKRLPLCRISDLAISREAGPHTHFFLDAIRQSLWREMGIDNDWEVFNGHGGDAIYSSSPSTASWIDAIATGHPILACRKILELAIFFRIPVWSVIYQGATRLKLRNMKCILEGLKFSFMLKPAEFEIYNSFKDTCNELNFQCSNKMNNVYNPLLLQPVVENAFQIKPYESFGAFFDRVKVRNSLSKKIDESVVWRRGKSELSEYIIRVIRFNKSEIYDSCVNGWCVNNGLIDKSDVKSRLQKVEMGLASDLVPILRVYAVENFVKSWK